MRLLSALAVVCALASGAALAAPSTPAFPPAIQKIMDKLSSGQQPTPAEQKALQQWGASMVGGAPAAPGGPGRAIAPVSSGETFTVGTGQAQNPCKPAGHAAGFGTTPSRDAYVAMAKDAMRTYRAHLAPQDQSRLDSALAQSAYPSFGGNLAAALVVGGFGSSAIVSAAYAAEKSPDDAVTASNLGALLRGMHDYARAAIALQYAKSKAPDSPVVASNLGWLAMSQGDSKTAGKFFSAAVTKNARLSTALLGQGLIAQCAGNSTQALPLFRASIANGFSDLAEAGIESAETDITAKNASASIGTPDSYGQKGSSGDMPDWQDPPFPSDVGAYNTMAMQLAPNGPFYKYQNYWLSVLTAQQNGQILYGSSSGSGRTITYVKGYDKQVFVLSDIRRMVVAMMDQTGDRWAKAVDDARARAGCNSCSSYEDPDSLARTENIEKCVYRPMVTAAHQALVPEEKGDWTELRQRFADLYGFSKPWLAQIGDASTLNAETWATAEAVSARGGAFAAELPLWGGEVVTDYNQAKCGPGAGAPPPKPQAVKPYKLDPTQCHSGSMSMNFGIANLNADCRKMTLTMGEGLVGSANINFAPDYTQDANGVLHPAQPDWSNDQVTIFVGAGASGEGALTANAAAGGYVTVQNGTMIDAGIQAQGGVTIGNGNETPLTGQAGVTAQVSVMSGPDTPTPSGTPVDGANVSTSAAPRVGGNCGVSC